MRKRHLTIAEKRDWLAHVFRDEHGEYSQADKFKAMVEDTRLAELEKEKEKTPAAGATPGGLSADMLEFLPPPLE